MQSVCSWPVGEEPVPFGRDSSASAGASPIGEGEPDALQGVERIVVQAFSRDDHQTPALALECLPSFDVLQPIGAHLTMVPAVVLDDEP